MNWLTYTMMTYRVGILLYVDYWKEKITWLTKQNGNQTRND